LPSIILPTNLGDYFLAGVSANRTNYDRKDLFAVPGLITGNKDQSFEKKYETAYTPHFAYRKMETSDL
jgi:iron complex outermembrane receptor protein